MSEDRWEAKYVDCVKRYEQMALAWENSRERHLAQVGKLQGALEKYGSHILDYSGTEGCRVGITDLEESCRCGFSEALAPAQEDGDE